MILPIFDKNRPGFGAYFGMILRYGRLFLQPYQFLFSDFPCKIVVVRYSSTRLRIISGFLYGRVLSRSYPEAVAEKMQTSFDRNNNINLTTSATIWQQQQHSGRNGTSKQEGCNSIVRAPAAVAAAGRQKRPGIIPVHV
jgi:hypothetical protein